MRILLMPILMVMAIMFLSFQTVNAQGRLSVYHWFEYIPQELVNKFTDETGIEVTIDTYDSNEAMLASLKAGALGSYDVAVPGDYMVKIMAEQGLLDTFSRRELRNFRNIENQWLNVDFDPGRKSSIPYQWGSTSFAVNTARYRGDINTTDILFDPPRRLSGRINMLDSQGEVMALASLHLGIEQCTNNRADLRRLSNLLQDAKQHWASFGSDVAKDVLVSGDAWAGMIYNGFSAKAREENPSITYAYPRQGYIVWMDSVVLLKDAPNRRNAIKFMDFLLRPENIAQVSNYAQYNSGVKGVSRYLDHHLRTQPESNPPSDVKGVFIEVCDERTQRLYDRIWTRLRK